MNEQAHEHHDRDNEPLAPLDEREQEWVALLCQRDNDLLADADAFVDGVMDRLERERGRAVLARIGRSLQTWKPLAVAAAVVLAGLVGAYVLNNKPASTPSNVAEQTPADTPPPAAAPHDSALAAARPRPEDVPVGQLIGSFSRSITQPQITVLPTDQPPTRLQKVLALFENPVDDATRFVPQRSEEDRG